MVTQVLLLTRDLRKSIREKEDQQIPACQDRSRWPVPFVFGQVTVWPRVCLGRKRSSQPVRRCSTHYCSAPSLLALSTKVQLEIGRWLSQCAGARAAPGWAGSCAASSGVLRASRMTWEAETECEHAVYHITKTWTKNSFERRLQLSHRIPQSGSTSLDHMQHHGEVRSDQWAVSASLNLPRPRRSSWVEP